MINKIKALGLAAVAIAAMSALAAPAAHAGELDIGAQPASLFAVQEPNQDHVLVLQKTNSAKEQNEFPVTCKKATLEGTTQGLKVPEATATATYSECTAFGVAATVQMNGCKYTITGAGQPANTAVVDIVGCTTGKTIFIDTAICDLDIGLQNGLAHIVGSQVNPQQGTLAAKVTGVKVQQTGAACPDGNLHTGTNSRFEGNTLGVAREDKLGSIVTEHNHQFEKLSQLGAQTTIQST
jgi:hypothetical protein